MKRVYCDNWEQGKDKGIEIYNPSWDEVKELILQLDNDKKTLVTFGDYDMGYYMAIGGGCGKYILYLSFEDDEKIFELVNSKKTEECYVELVVGGQRGRYPKNSCMRQSEVLVAAETFFKYQIPDKNLIWKE